MQEQFLKASTKAVPHLSLFLFYRIVIFVSFRERLYWPKSQFLGHLLCAMGIYNRHHHFDDFYSGIIQLLTENLCKGV